MNYKKIGAEIRRVRLLHKLTQEQLAEQASLSPSYVSCIERGKKKVSLTALVRIAEALEVGVDELLGTARAEECGEFRENWNLLEDCSPAEKQIIRDTTIALKQSLHLYGQIA